MVSLGPQNVSRETERIRETGELCQPFAGKAVSAKRRERMLSAFSVNPTVGFVRRGSNQLPERNTLRNNTLRISIHKTLQYKALAISRLTRSVRNESNTPRTRVRLVNNFESTRNILSQFRSERR